ncbi:MULTISPECIES: MarR family winged helix-turn-helix transcriptional regulator [unclassified Haematospirillum]|uniref:MarR family winged helix-turn-helix transcriptional regulator n=1 Tax=unclassified Haematospirillum TaxID=2622088 RepID=UPI00143BB2FB|nr:MULTISPECIES: MarR family winged helix-turn-helix transcriptional regulator [unclassified Haematospirillum]NKD55140.1 winged helix-turn-helix transcriptional regulator [Haematospirillum sp. H4890]NKD75393.1 winged helix-turn-helix transcriptional regulator [Haematospirillum sp. H4485]
MASSSDLSETGERPMDLSQFSAFMLAFTKRYPRTHATALQVLLGVADSPGITTRDLREDMGLTQSAISRNVGLLGGGYAHGGKTVKGYGLVSAYPCIEDNRTHTVMISRRGKKVLSELLAEARIS